MRDKKLAAILLFALLTRLVVFIIFQPWNETVVTNDVFIYDAIGYNILAKCIAFNFSFCADTFRTPVYPAFVALFYWLFGVKVWVVLLAQILLNVISGYLLFKISERLFFNKNIGYIALILFALDPQQIIFTTYLYTDTLFVLFFLWSMYLFIKAIQEGKSRLFFYSGILFGLTILTRPIAIYFPVLLFVYIIVQRNFSLKMKLRNAVLFTACAYLMLVPWMYRNYKSYDHFALSSINGYNLLFYNAAYTEVNKSHKTYDQVCNEFVQLAKSEAPENLKSQMPQNIEQRLHGLTFEKSDVYNDVAKQYLKKNLFSAIKAHLSGSVKLHLNMGSEVIMQRLHLPVKRWTDTEKYSGSIFTLAKRFFNSKTTAEVILGLLVLGFLFFIYITAFIGLVQLSFVQKQWMTAIFIVMLVGYFAFISGIFYTPRYRLPFMPFYMLLSGICISGWKRRIS
ncbi:MAG: hypothetical protein JWN78_1803 [Bacteroidota bacterium]|nr:hypothetical protein [Bacteroidota bacterium]